MSFNLKKDLKLYYSIENNILLNEIEHKTLDDNNFYVELYFYLERTFLFDRTHQWRVSTSVLGISSKILKSAIESYIQMQNPFNLIVETSNLIDISFYELKNGGATRKFHVPEKVIKDLLRKFDPKIKMEELILNRDSEFSKLLGRNSALTSSVFGISKYDRLKSLSSSYLMYGQYLDYTHKDIDIKKFVDHLIISDFGMRLVEDAVIIINKIKEFSKNISLARDAKNYQKRLLITPYPHIKNDYSEVNDHLRKAAKDMYVIDTLLDKYDTKIERPAINKFFIEAFGDYDDDPGKNYLISL